MENKRGILSHFGTIIRVIILIILVAVITFFVVKFIRDRQASRRAEQGSSQVAQIEKQESDESEKEEKAEDKQTDFAKQNNNGEEQQIPSGIADGEDSDDSSASSTTPVEVPAVGMGTNALLTAGLLSLIAYVVTRKLLAAQSANT